MFNHRLHCGQNEDPRYQEVRLPVNEPFANAILPKLTDGILLLNLEGTFQVANAALLKILNLEAKNLLYRRFWDVFPDEYFGFSMQEALRYGISHQLIYHSSPPKEWEISTSFVYEGPKERHGLILFLRDITHTQKNQQMAIRADRMRELGEMAAKLAHEMRNCLGGIRGFACLLFRDLVKQPNLQEMISRIIEGTKSLERLLTTILVYARPLTLSERTIDLSQFLKQVAKTLKVDPNFPTNIQFRLHIPDEVILVPVDPDALKRALLNLLLNGLQAMEKGGELTLSLLNYETTCQIAISDTGIGMNEEQQNDLFSPFFTTKSNGNGLGLVETKKIIQGHGGTIGVHSTPGRGSTFLLTLPCKRHP